MLIKHDKKLCGIFYYRPQTIVVECSFFGNYEKRERDFKIAGAKVKESEIVLTGERYLKVESIRECVNWTCDKVQQDIRQSDNSIYFINDSPYLKAALSKESMNYYFPPMYAGGISLSVPAKVHFVELSSFKEEGQRFSEKEELNDILEELILNKKIIINSKSQFQLSELNHVNSLMMLVKALLPYFIMEEISYN
ncbi:hypothetical protein ACWATR_37120 [Nostoc sp. UIC 10890]